MELSVRSHRSSSRSIRDMEPSRMRLYQYTSIVFVISILSNIPVFLEFTLGTNPETLAKQVEVTPLRMDIKYIIFFKNGFEGIVLMILPLILMVCFNARIICTLKKRGRSILCGIGPNRQMRNEMNLGKVLVVMDIVFLICNLGRVIVNVWELFHIQEMKECMGSGSWLKVTYYWIQRVVSKIF